MKKQEAISKGRAEQKLKIGSVIKGSLAELGPINGRTLEPVNAIVGELDRLDRYDRDHLKYENHQADVQAQRQAQAIYRLRKAGSPGIPLQSAEEAIS